MNPQLDTHFVQYTAAASKTRKLTFRQRIGLVESSALRELGARLRERSAELQKEFQNRDPDNTGKFFPRIKENRFLLSVESVFFYLHFLVCHQCVRSFL